MAEQPGDPSDDVVAQAFLSYARSDDKRERGRITRLAEHLSEEFETLTGSKLMVFTDRRNIEWGQDFRGRLDEALEQTTFFIPILTATYFKRDECRREMQTFVTSAQRLGLDRLLLSIRYAPVPDLREGSADSLKDLAARTQYEPWEHLRLLDENSAEHRQAVHGLAERIVRLTSSLESASPASEPGGLLAAVSPPTGRDRRVDSQDRAPAPDDNAEVAASRRVAVAVEDGDDEPGTWDVLADVGPAFAEWNEAITEVSHATSAFAAKFTAATEFLPATNSAPDGLAKPILAYRALAKDIEPELSEMERLSSRYAAGVLRLDPVLRALGRIAESEGADTQEAFEGLQSLAGSARDAMSKLSYAADAARDNAKHSRDLRPVLRRFETATRNIVEASGLIDEWEVLLAPDSD